ncbi:hypothetical protein [Alloyangia pacifica]|uniref:Uncharacterized protein n=1 Tax=Alloyangia pacifica TaxID=311180 RepID=A0A1I6PNE9_9RHOB|nr:hypothetical protein [Alloyangia pacifica]SDG32100.1 hypothetical protein SAMN04488245_102361 [Alloyangia pacifica]SFS41719.1 hypothetical protein SAMN04488050_101662 [Alloyangia pacifica]
MTGKVVGMIVPLNQLPAYELAAALHMVERYHADAQKVLKTLDQFNAAARLAAAPIIGANQ